MAEKTKAPRGRRRTLLSGLLAFIVGLAVLSIVLRLLNPLPSQENRSADAPVSGPPGIVTETASAATAAQPGKSGLEVIATGIDAFATRLALARAATRSIDAQYYIWEGDLSGRMLLAELVKAADRGVRVRVLVDDNTTSGLDAMWAAANAHPNLSVRLFNPLTIRSPRAANYLFSALRLNRRMHNKSMTFDGAVTVIGGRNVGDEYFGAKAKGLFIDLDVAAVGPIVGKVEDEFETYWQSISAFPAERLLKEAAPDGLDALRNPSYDDPARATEYAQAAEKNFRLRYEGDQAKPLLWTDVRLVADNPDKALARVDEADLVAAQIGPLIAGATERFDLISGYFVPGRQGTDLLEGIARRGVKVRVVTNGIEVTDVPVVHAGYTPSRKPLLDAGVRLYEVKTVDGQHAEAKDFGTKFSGGGESVHAKTFIVDGRTIFIGSFNFDLRSALLNCEMGFIFDAPELASTMNETLDQRLPTYAYAVARNADGALTWNSEREGKVVTVTPEPGTTAFTRTVIGFLGILPIKWLL